MLGGKKKAHKKYTHCRYTSVLISLFLTGKFTVKNKQSLIIKTGFEVLNSEFLNFAGKMPKKHIFKTMISKDLSVKFFN